MEDKSASENAKDLINKFYQPLGYLESTRNSNELWEHAKVSALTCTKVMIESARRNLALAEKELHPHAQGLMAGEIVVWTEIEKEIKLH